jgi:hypothetical protein
VASPLRYLLLAGVLLTAGAGCSGTISPGDTATGRAEGGGRNPNRAGPTAHLLRAAPTCSAGSCHFRYNGGQPLPDSTCTPGAVSPDVTQATITSTICRKGGYTSGIRPPVGITDKEKHANAASHGYTGPLHDADIGNPGYQNMRNAA